MKIFRPAILVTCCLASSLLLACLLSPLLLCFRGDRGPCETFCFETIAQQSEVSARPSDYFFECWWIDILCHGIVSAEVGQLFNWISI